MEEGEGKRGLEVLWVEGREETEKWGVLRGSTEKCSLLLFPSQAFHGQSLPPTLWFVFFMVMLSC